MFKTILSLILLFPGVSCLISEASAEKTQSQTANSELVEVLLKYGKRAPSWPAINAAMSAGDIKAVKVLVENGADINTRINYQSNYGVLYGETVLEMAIQNNDKNLIKYLLKHGADPHLEANIGSNTAGIPSWVAAIKREGKQVVFTAVYIALITENIELFAVLIENGADINKPCLKKDGFHLTPLQVAIRDGLTGFIEYLLSKGAKI